MPTKPVKQITAWSFSRLADWEGCPAYAKYKHIDKLGEGEERDVFVKGNAAHKDCENYIRRVKGAKITDVMKHFAEDFERLRKQCPPKIAECELELAYTREMNPTAWKDWNGAWLRVKKDLSFIVGPKPLVMPGLITNADGSASDLEVPVGARLTIDYKTGKVRDDLSQLRLYNLASFFDPPKVKLAVSMFWYLEHGVTRIHTLPAGDVDAELAYWRKRVLPMFQDTVFMPRPSRRCTWPCPYSKSQEGPCPY